MNQATTTTSAAAAADSAKGWRTSAAKATKLCDALKQQTTGSNNVEQRLHSVAHDIAAVQQRLLDKEDTILNGGKYAAAIDQYRNARDRLNSLRTEHTTLSSTVADQTSELTDLTTRLDATKRSVKDKGRRMTDTTPLIRIKTAIQTVREEMHEMDVRIGILSHLLLQSQMGLAQRNTRKMQHEEQYQHHHGLTGHYDGIDTTSGSDDDDENDEDSDDF